MAEEKELEYYFKGDIGIKKCEQGFVVVDSHFGLQAIRAFSTAEGLIEWLSRELGAGPIVWGLTLDLWALKAGVIPEDLVKVPEPGVDPARYQEALSDNARFILDRLLHDELVKLHPKPPPEPKPKKEKKVKEKRGKDGGGLREDFLEVKDLTFPKGSKEEVKEE